jgi:hypothetical protein
MGIPDNVRPAASAVPKTSGRLIIAPMVAIDINLSTGSNVRR